MATKTAPAAPANDWTTRKDWTPAQIASELNIDAKSLRRVIRTHVPVEYHPGKGGSWLIPADIVPEIVERIGQTGQGRKITLTRDMLS